VLRGLWIDALELGVGGMEPAVGKSKGKKRKRKDGEDADKTADKPARKTVLAMRSVVFVGRYVKKEFESGVFLGKIVSYDSGLYRVVYEDEDFEDLETHEAKVLLVGEDEMDAAFRKRKKSLDQYLLKKFAKKESRKDAVRVDAAANKDICSRKLAILQLLCDDASNSAEIRTEIDNREESEIGPDPDGATVSKATIGDDVDEDGNGDECRLCGMDGTLICCDGCPSSYHSRCIGMMKLSIPEGEWYCPECTINRTGPIVTKATSLRGAEFFGIDPYEQVFLGSCDHLLVMKASTSSGSHIQYYSPVDIPKVLLALTSSAEYAALYLEICKSILQYWEIPENVFSLPDSIGIDDKSGTTNAQDVVIAAENVTAVAEYDSKDVVPACHVEKCEELGFGQDSLNESATENGNCNNKGDINAQDVVITAENVTAVAEYDKDVVTACRVEKCEEFGFGQGSLNESATENGNCNIKSDINAQNVVITAENVTAVAEYDSKDVVTACRVEKCEELGFGQDSLNESATNKSDINSVHDLSSFPSQKTEANLAKFYTGSSFKPQAYLNVYINGDFAASAGASLAILSSEEKPSTQTQPSTVSRRKLMSANYSLQAKAFSLAAKRFYWPNYEKRLVEVSRERCGWCLSCKATVISKRGCLLNAAASNAIKGSESQPGQSAKSVTGPTQKRGTGRRGRKTSIIPELSDADANDLSIDFAWWRGGMLSKHIFQKGVLPQMMIKHAARKGGCEKISSVQYVDGLEVPKRSRQFIWRAAVDLSKTASQLALQVRYLDLHVRWNELVCPDQPPQDGKGPEAEASAFRNACIFDKKILGNKISYGVVFENQKHLPSRVLKKVLEVEETGDRRSKNWFLETHIPLYLIKEYEVAVVADVKLPTSDIKHVSKSSRLNKRQLNASGKNIFSFLEQKKNNMGKCFCTFCQLDVSFRTAARCSACQGYCHEQCAVGTNIHTVARVEFLITCKRCYIEKEAASKNEVVGDSPTSPLLLQGQESQHSATVIKIKLGKQNGQEKPLAYSNPTSRRPQNSRSGKKSSKRRQLQSDDQKPNDNNLKASSNKKTNSKSKRLCLGLIWKKKNPNDTGTEFRTNNILLKGNPNGHRLAPRCQLCAKPYNSDLTYILCEKCNNWFHAEAVELQESKIVDLFGFKCCRCRRIKIPACPYADPDAHQKSGAKREALANCQRQKNLGSDSDSEFISDTYDEELDWELDFAPAFDYEEEVVNVQEENPYYSYPTIDQVNDDKPDVDFGPGPKKLPVRRHIKPEKDSNVSFEFPNTYSGINNPNPDPAQEESSTPFVEWDVSTNEVADDMMFDYGVLNYEDMEFEPQTYFSFNELLASDEADKVGDPQVTGPATVDCNPEQYQMGITFDEQEPMFSVETGLDMVPCKVCSQTDPCPDLFCQTCGLWLHQHCSPWEEDSSWEPETGWKCGNCKGSC
ncbi:hypothetical protein M8C21_008034, partial [Ambrosia artemisiifolia]